jgi:TolB protein
MMIGYNELRTNLPGGRHANVATMRACLVQSDGTGRRVLAEELVKDEDTGTQFAGWSPDGRWAILHCAWESPENAAWEETHKEFRMTEGWLVDTLLLNLLTGKISNLTAVQRVSDYNTGIFFWPGDPGKLGFTALINGISHPFSMDLDGRNKKDLSQNSGGYAYGYSASPDGALITYHEDYQIYLARADGSEKKHIKTGNPFNFGPVWSNDGERILFLSGEHYDCHPYVVGRDGAGLKKTGDRNGYVGGVEFLDVYDFHGGSSDTPIWSPDGRGICFAGKIGRSVELQMVDLDGKTRQLTFSKPDVLNYQPKFSPDGRWIIFGSNRTGTRQLYVMDREGKNVYPVTDVKPGWGAMWPYWKPENKELKNE